MTDIQLLLKLEKEVLYIDTDRHQYSSEDASSYEKEVASKMVKNAVRKTVSRKPTTTIATKIIKGKITGYPIYHCNSCGKRLMKTHNYCSLCGQRVDWD